MLTVDLVEMGTTCALSLRAFAAYGENPDMRQKVERSLRDALHGCERIVIAEPFYVSAWVDTETGEEYPPYWEINATGWKPQIK